MKTQLGPGRGPERACLTLRHLDRLEHSRRRNEEGRDGPADPLLEPRRHLLGGRPHTGGGRECEPVQIDAGRGLDELGVVATPEPCGDLDHLRATRADTNLRVRRTALDPECRDGTARDLGCSLGVR